MLLIHLLRVWVWILTILYVIQAIAYFIGAISLSANIDEVKGIKYWFIVSSLDCQFFFLGLSMTISHFHVLTLERAL